MRPTHNRDNSHHAHNAHNLNNVRDSRRDFLKHFRLYKRVSTPLIAFVLAATLTAGLIVIRGRAAGLSFHWPAGLGSTTSIFGSLGVPSGSTPPNPFMNIGGAATVYVDDDWVGETPGADPDGGGPATNFGVDAFATIQDGVNGVAAGGTVIVNEGTYTENVTIAQPLTLTGAGEASVTLRPPVSDPNCGGAGGGSLCGSSNLILVQADNVSISGMTLDGDNTLLTSGVVVGGADIDARNGIITNHNTGIFNNLVVHHLTVKNVFLRGIYASSGGSFNFHHDTVQNVAGDAASSIAMFNFGGVGTFDTNTVFNSNDGIASNASLGTQYTNNHVTNCTSGGIHTDNAGDGPLVSNDLISGNTVDNSPAGGYGIFAYQPRATVTIQNNTVTNVENGLASFGRLPSLGFRPAPATSTRPRPRVVGLSEPGAVFLSQRDAESQSPNGGPVTPDATVFTGNTIDAQNKANSTGVALTTDQLNSTSGDAGITFNQNTVIANVTGVSLNADAGFTLTVLAAFNRLVATTTALSQTGTGTLNATMENNWWGCNAGPGNAGCGAVIGTGADFNPWIDLRGSATPNSIIPGGTSTVAADMTHNSDNAVVGTLPNIPVSYSATNGTMNPTSDTIVAGADSSTFTSTNASNAVATITVDNENVNLPITVTAPSFSIDDLTHLEGNAGTTSYTFTITKTGATALNASVNYETVNGTATAPSDFTAIAVTNVVFLPGETSKQVTVQVNGDTTFETTEAFTVHLSSAVDATISDADGTGTITNDDTQPTISIDDVTRTESNAGTVDYDFTVSLSNESYQTITVNAATADSTATTGDSDYVAVPSTVLTFAPNTTTQQFHVTVNGDTKFEIDEQFLVNLSGATNATITDNQGAGTITNDDTQPAISIDDVAHNEGLKGSVDYDFTVSLSNASYQTVTVSAATADDTATTADSDYAGVASTLLTFTPDATTQQFHVTVNGDNKFEADETFFVNVSGATNATIGDNQGVGTITNDDPLPTISIDDVTLSEGNPPGTTNFVFTVTLSNPSYQTITVDYATANNTATAPSDFTAIPTTQLTFNPAETSKQITVVVNRDIVYELNESFFVNLSNPANATTTDQGVGTINNDDAQPTLAIGDRTLNEGTLLGTSTSFNFTVTKSGSTEVTATVNFATADGTAIGNAAPCPSGFDYQSQAGALSFLANENSKTITVPVCKDSTFEGNETFFVNLTPGVHATITDNQGLGTILNDDIPSSGFTVNATDDLDDGVCDVSGHCSLREAIVAANGSATAVAITFAIPAGDPRHFYYQDDNSGGGPNGTLGLVAQTTAANDAALPTDADPDWLHSWWSILPTSQLPATTKQTFIDGYSQSDATFNSLTTGTNAVLRIELDGLSAGANVSGLTIGGGTSTVRGLVINRFQRDAGAATPAGIGLNLQSTNHNIQGNFIGTDVSGTVDLGNVGSGISAAGSNMNIGGPTPDLVNLLSGNDGDGITFTNSNSNVIFGNLIGTRANGTSALGNGGNGITFASSGSLFNTLGGTGSGEANTLAFNGGDGVQVAATAGIGHAIRGNSIFSNGTTNLHLGIDLDADGVTPNDPADPDPSPSPQRANNLQNFPIITLAEVTGSTRTITGTLNSTVGQTFDIDFFQSPACDVSGNGEGKTYLGSITTGVTDTNGDVAFTFNPPVLSGGQFVTATATSTGASFSTSEFSACTMVDAGAAGDIQFTDATYNVSEGGGSASITVTRVGGSDGSITATFSTSDGTAQAPGDYTVSNFPVTYADGETGTKTVNVLITNDTIYEGTETVNLSLSPTQVNSPSIPQVDPHSAVLTITDNDAPPSFTINDVQQAEGNSGTTSFVFTVTKTGSTGVSATVDYATANGTATAPSDYSAIPPTTLTFLPADTTKQFTVLVNGDPTVEANESFFVNLANATNATIVDGQGQGTITNDDTDVTVTVSPAAVSEDGAPNLVYTFTRNGVTFVPLTVRFSVAGTAVFPTDYTQTGAATFDASTGTVTFDPGNTTAVVTIDPTADATAESDETVILTVTAGDDYNVASPSSATGTITNDDAAGGIIRFSSPFYNTTESSRFVTITVERAGDTSGAATVDYATPDDSDASTVVPCANITGSASPRCDFTTALGTLRFAAGETSKTFIVLISQDNYFDSNETLTLTLSNLTGGAVFGVPSTATLTIADDLAEPTQNPIDDPENFVRQHYHDFLNREPDAPGLAFWVNEITSCGSNQQCIADKRVQVSAAFYLSIEFQGTGYLVERLYKAAYGDATGSSTIGGAHTLPVPIVRFSEFLPDTQEIGQGVVVGQPGWEAALENNRAAFVARFVERARFTNGYPLSVTPEGFVDTLNANAGNPLSPAERNQLVSDLSMGIKTRAQVLRAVAEDSDLASAEFRRAFVLMQYFGYLRRNPNAAQDTDYSGYDFWLTKLNEFNGDFRAAEMVKAFIVSSEYRERAGQ